MRKLDDALSIVGGDTLRTCEGVAAPDGRRSIPSLATTSCDDRADSCDMKSARCKCAPPSYGGNLFRCHYTCRKFALYSVKRSGERNLDCEGVRGAFKFITFLRYVIFYRRRIPALLSCFISTVVISLEAKLADEFNMYGTPIKVVISWIIIVSSFYV